MTVPVTRNLAELIAACRIVEAELAFQVDRLAEVDPARSGSNPEHIERSRTEYGNAVVGVARLRRYQEGRHRKQEEAVAPAQPYFEVFPEVSEVSPFIGPAAAHVEE